MDKPIWVIMLSSGEYDDRSTYPHEYCLTEEEANNRVKQLRIEEDSLRKSHEDGTIRSHRNEALVAYAKKYNLDYHLYSNYNNQDEVEVIHNNNGWEDDDTLDNDWMDIFDKYPEQNDRIWFHYQLVNPSPKTE